MLRRFLKSQLFVHPLEDRTTPNGTVPVVTEGEVKPELPTEEVVTTGEVVVGETVDVPLVEGPVEEIPTLDPNDPRIFQTVGPAPTERTDDDTKMNITSAPVTFAVDIDPSRQAFADVNGDGFQDNISVTKAGEVVKLTVSYGNIPDLTISTTKIFESRFTGGARVAAGDMDGDGRAEIVVSADKTGSSRIVVLKAYSNPTANTTPDGKFASFTILESFASFYGIEDTKYRGGTSVAIADMNLDGVGDLIVSASDTGGPRVAVFDGATMDAVGSSATGEVTYTGNINPSLPVGEQVSTTIQIVDQRSTIRNLQVKLKKLDVNTFSLTVSAPHTTLTVPPTVLIFDSRGRVTGNGIVDITLTTTTQTQAQNIKLNFSGITQTSDSISFNASKQDGGVRQTNQKSQTNPTRLVADFFALPDASFRGGISIDAGDVNGDGTPDLIVGAGAGGGQRARVISGVDILASKGAGATPLADFFLGGQDNGDRNGVLVAYAEPLDTSTKAGSVSVYTYFRDSSTNKLTISGPTFFQGKSMPKPVGVVPDLDNDRVVIA